MISAPALPKLAALPKLLAVPVLLGVLCACSSGGAGYAPDPPAPTYPATASPRAEVVVREDGSSSRRDPSSGAGAAASDDSGGLKPGARGGAVRALQQRLQSLGFWVGPADGTYGLTTTQAVMALQKANGLGRDGVLGARTRQVLGRPITLSPKSDSGHVIEVDKRRQLVLIVDDGAVSTIINTSTGSNRPYQEDGQTSIARTPSGSFRITRQIDGPDHAPLGDLWRPKFFNRGIALHGAAAIPGYPASHGCARMSNAAINWIWATDQAPIGTRVLVY